MSEQEDIPEVKRISKELSRIDNEIMQSPDVARENQGILRTLFPRDQERHLAEVELSVVRTQAEFRLRALEIASKSKIEMLRKACEAKATTDGIAIDVEKERRIKELLTERERQINQATQEFYKNFEEAHQRAESFKIARVKEKELQRLSRSLEDFYERIEHFDQEFMESLKFSAKH